ncbi:hypothetical protein P3W45_001822 [Vairimorpha bombi]|jgi:hypothetical protein
MDNLKRKLLKEAESLRETKRIFFIPLSYPDYESSADKFKEVSLMCIEKSEKIKYLKEAAKTYLMNPVEYNRYNTYLVYQDIAEMYREGEEAVDYFIQSGDMALSCNKESLAAKSYEKASELCDNTENKIKLLSKIVKCYDNNSWKHHRTNALKILSFELFKNGEYEKAASNFLLIKSSIYTLCAGMCYYLAGVDSDLEVDNEHKEVYDSLFKDETKIVKAIENFLDNHSVEKDVRNIMEICIDKMNPDNDIL